MCINILYLLTCLTICKYVTYTFYWFFVILHVLLIFIYFIIACSTPPPPIDFRTVDIHVRVSFILIPILILCHPQFFILIEPSITFTDSCFEYDMLIYVHNHRSLQLPTLYSGTLVTSCA